MSSTDDNATPSQFVNPTERVIFEAAGNLLKDVSSRVSSRAYDSEASPAEVLNLGSLRSRLDVASEAIFRALVSLDVNAEHYRTGPAHSAAGAAQAGELAARHLATVDPEPAS